MSLLTLADVAQAYPPQQGLAEVVAYLKIAAHMGAAIDETTKDTIIMPVSSIPGVSPDGRREM